MRTFLVIEDAATNATINFLDSLSLYNLYRTAAQTMSEKGITPTKASDGSYKIDSLSNIIGFTKLRVANTQKEMLIDFFGVKLFQNGADAKNEDSYYVGMADNNKERKTLSYPAMRREIEQSNDILAPLSKQKIKSALNFDVNKKAEALAVAALFIAEGGGSAIR